MYAAGVFPVRLRCGRLWSSAAGGLWRAPPLGTCFRVGGWEKESGLEGFAALPHAPHGGEDLALGVEPRVAHVVGAFEAGAVEALHGVVARGAFAAGAPGVIAQGLELAVASPFEPLIAQGLAILAAFYAGCCAR